MDKGAHYYRCDFQVHTPRDKSWTGSTCVTDDERNAYAQKLVQACREKGVQSIAITDHHDMTFVPFIRKAALEESDDDGVDFAINDRLIVFPGMELTIGVPCQAILIFDADFPEDMFSLAMTALAITQTDKGKSKTGEVVQLSGIQNINDLCTELDKHTYLRGKYIIFPNVSGEGKHSLLRNGQMEKYKSMPCFGGYTDGEYEKLKSGPKNILSGKDKSWGNKKIACIQTSDSRRDDHTTIGKPSTWIKWAGASAEALRQACLAQESRISLVQPKVPETYIASVSISNSSFLGPTDLEFNPQYSALIGGRGTGKSTILEYVRWALCDQPPEGDETETPNYQARRRRLIESTLKSLSATVEVVYFLNGVRHVIRRSSLDGSVQMKISSDEPLPCSEGEVRRLLPIQAYSQKQMSDVSVRVDELQRFITAPIKGQLDRLNRTTSDLANRIRETYATRQRFQDLSRLLKNRLLEEKSITEQAKSIRDSLDGLSKDDREILDRGETYVKANSLISSWKAGATTLQNNSVALQKTIISQMDAIQPIPEYMKNLKEKLDGLQKTFQGMLESSLSEINNIVEASLSFSNSITDKTKSSWEIWDKEYQDFQDLYKQAVKQSSSHTEKLTQLKELETKLVELSDETTRTKEMLSTLGLADKNYLIARDEWLQSQDIQDTLIDRECEVLTARSGGLIRVKVQRLSDHSEFTHNLGDALSGSRIQKSKFELLGENLVGAENTKDVWLAALDELEALASYNTERSVTEERPNAPTLLSLGMAENDIEKIIQKLTPENWLSISLTPIESKPIYEFQAREGDYIPFRNASAGQQATALLKTLLNQPGPPLIIDQPEEDLDNPVMLEIVEQIWAAKQLRQIIFASHNANLVVNGDAELVAWFGYRTIGDQSRGTIKGEGAIDIPEAKEAIKQIMEGGEAAFRLRREKYGF